MGKMKELDIERQQSVIVRTAPMQGFLDNLTEQLFGVSSSEAQEKQICISCKKPAVKFNDELSAREYKISGMCQDCQDNFFNMEEE